MGVPYEIFEFSAGKEVAGLPPDSNFVTKGRDLEANVLTASPKEHLEWRSVSNLPQPRPHKRT